MREVGDNNLPKVSNSEKEPEFSARGVSVWIKKTLLTGTSVTRELREFLNGIEIRDILLKALSNAKLEVHATIRLVPDQETVKISKSKAISKNHASQKK